MKVFSKIALPRTTHHAPRTFFVAAALLLVFLSLSASAALEKKEFKLSEAPLSLERALQIATENNRQIKSAQHDLTMAERKISESRAQYDFKLTADGNWQRVHDSSSFPLLAYTPATLIMTATSTIAYPSGGVSVVSPGTPIVYAEPMAPMNVRLSAQQARKLDMTLSRPIISFGKKRDLIHLYKRGRDSKDLEVTRTELEVDLKTREAFFNFLLAKRSAEVMEKTLKLEEEHLNAAKKREEQGTIPHFDVLRAEVGMATARENLTKAETGRELARMALNNVLGLPVERPTDIDYDDAAAVMPKLADSEKYIETALNNRVEIEQIGIAEDQARTGARLQKNKPMVSFSALYNLINNGSAFSSENTWRYVVNYTADIVDSGLSHAKVAQALQAAEQLNLKKTDAREGIILQTRQAYLNLLEAGKRLSTSRAIMNQAAQARAMAYVGHEQGIVSEIDWKDALNGEVQAGLNLARAEYDLEMAKARLANAMGIRSLDEIK